MISNTFRTDAERAVWLQWVLASTVGMVAAWQVDVANFVGSAVKMLVRLSLARGRSSLGTEAWRVVGSVSNAVGNAMGWIAYGAVIGALIGSAQWFVLRRRVHRAGRWVLASTTGVAVASIVSLALGLVKASELHSDITSLYDLMGRASEITGDALLWIHGVDSAMYVIVIGASLGVMQWFVLRRRVHRAGWWVLASAVGWAVGWAGSSVMRWIALRLGDLIVGALVGAITGFLLIWLLRQPNPEA